MEKWKARVAVVRKLTQQIPQNTSKRMKAFTGPATFTSTFVQESDEVNKSFRKRSSASSPNITSHIDDHVENGLLTR